jgi:predicted DNA-binding WGR domain protein
MRALPFQHDVVLYRCDPEQGRARFYSLMIERDLFGTIRLVRKRGYIGSKSPGKVDTFPAEAAHALGVWAVAQRKRGYTDL